MHTLLQDLRYGARMLVKNPGFTAVAVLTLALGIGANTTIFSLVNAVFLTEITADAPERLLHVDVGRANQVSFPNYHDLAESGALAGLAGYSSAELNWRRDDGPDKVRGYVVTANFFDVLGVQAQEGRVFGAREARAELNPQLAVVSHRFWQRRLGANPPVLGRVLRLNDRPYTVIGVLPSGYRAVGEYGAGPEVYLPLNTESCGGLNNRAQICLELVGRLPEGMSKQQAHAALAAAAQGIEQIYPRENEGFGKVWRIFGLSRLERLKEARSNEVVLFAGLLGIVVGLVLLVACTNVAGLLLARGTVRRREIAVRLALGASRGRVLRQLLTESLLLATVGTALGLWLNFWLTRLINRVQLPAFVSFEVQLAPDTRLLLYAVLLLAGSTLICGLLPALAATRADFVAGLKQEEPRFVGQRLSLRKAMVVGQVAISLLLLVAASLFVRSLRAIVNAEPGFDAAHTLSATVNFPLGRDTRGFYDQATERLLAVPGVSAASCAAIAPFSFSTASEQVAVEGRAQENRISVGVNAIAPRYFETMGIRLLRGREFQAGDREGAPPVAIINDTFARRHFPNEDPLGKKLLTESASGRQAMEIIGVVRDTKQMATDAAAPFVYRSYKQPPPIRRLNTLVVRSAGSPNAILKGVQQAIREIEPSAAVEIRTFEDRVAFSIMPIRIAAALLTTLGGLGLLLAMVGLYGVMAYTVSYRTAEIGVRMALGATRSHVLRMVIREGLLLVSVGAGFGVAISVIATRPLAIFLAPGVGAMNPISLAGVTIVLGVVALLACIVPARRAMRVDPMVALRHE